MVSTRLMSSFGGGEGSSGMSVEAASVAVSRVTRHSSTLAPGGSSPPSHAAPPPLASPPPPSQSQRYSVLPAPRTFNTSLLDLPIEVHEKIFSFLGFKSVSQMRMVSVSFSYATSDTRFTWWIIVFSSFGSFNLGLPKLFWLNDPSSGLGCHHRLKLKLCPGADFEADGRYFF